MTETKKKQPNLFITFLIILVGSVLVNIGVFYLADAIGGIRQDLPIPADRMQITLVPVALVTAVSVVLAVVVYLLITIIKKRAFKIFAVLSFLVLFLSMGMPFILPEVPLVMAVWLNVMHFVVAFFVLYFLSKYENEKYG